MAQQTMPLNEVIRRVQSMANDSRARQIVQAEKYNIHTVTWEDCARNKGSVWGPCISDMTLQVGDSRMPVIRENNYTDTTWDVDIEKIPVVVGNEICKDKSESKENEANGENGLTTISLKEYLRDFDKYMSSSMNPNNAAMNNMLENDSQSNKINLLRKEESKDSHVIVSSQACFLPIESGKETLFNVALFNYQSKKQDPAILAIVATSKGTSAQIIEGRDEKLLFNNNGQKADFIGQRLTDNRIERGIEDLTAPMTTQEKQDNCILIIQVPLKQKPKRQSDGGYRGGGRGGSPLSFRGRGSGASRGRGMNLSLKYKPMRKCSNSSLILDSANEVNVESAIVKVAPKTHPVCVCGSELEKLQYQFCYDNYGKPYDEMIKVDCDECGILIAPDSGLNESENKSTLLWHCKNEKNTWKHQNGYDLCLNCAKKQLKFDELNGMKKSEIKRDERYPIRVTLQYYKSTDNGVINENIMKAISKQLKESQKGSDFIGSLVTEFNPLRKTEWIKYQAFKMDTFGIRDNRNYGLIRDVLGNLELSQYFGDFVSNEISDARLVLLDESDLKLIFKKVGPMIVFRHWLRNYKQGMDKNDKQNEQNMVNNGNNNNVDFGIGLFN